MRTKSFYRLDSGRAAAAARGGGAPDDALDVDDLIDDATPDDVYVYCEERHGPPCAPEVTWWEPREPDASFFASA